MKDPEIDMKDLKAFAETEQLWRLLIHNAYREKSAGNQFERRNILRNILTYERKKKPSEMYQTLPTKQRTLRNIKS